ncbi:DUF222 domain-containing protein [Naumannella sp. ID2617S]|nr:DUF222 domain-containing protein [Naumannella sp. ID2617S]
MTPTTSRAELLAAVTEYGDQITTLEAKRLVTIAALCDAYAALDRDEEGLFPHVLHGEQLVMPGFDGTPEVAEFFHLELAIALGCSPESAQCWVADVLNLRHRHPILWQATVDGLVPVWVARKVPQACRHLSFQQARQFDSEWAPKMPGWTPGKIINVTETRAALLLDAEEHRQATLNSRHVSFHPSRTPGITHVEGTLDAGAAAQLDATLNRVADVLRAGGATDSREALRADALGHLAHPDRARRLLSPSLFDGAAVTPTGEVVNTDGEIVSPDHEACRHGAELIVHVNALDLIKGRGGESPELGPVLRTQLEELLAHCGGTVKVRPVVDLNEPIGVSTYRPSEELAWRVKVRDGRVLFPYSNRSARGRGVDNDHTREWPEGPTHQTNLAPFTRTPHRAKTHAGFRVEQIKNGLLHWMTPAGQQAWTSCHGTWRKPPPGHVVNDPTETTRKIWAILFDAAHTGRKRLHRDRGPTTGNSPP